MKLHEYANTIDPWGCYGSDELAADFLEKTGNPAPWHGYPARVANRTVGQFKGLQRKLDVPDEKKMVDGWKAVESIWSEYGKTEATPAERECISMMNGRGSIADACIRSLQRQGL